jgi:glycosyltransferase involved in cell wall biosynthesis
VSLIVAPAEEEVYGGERSGITMLAAMGRYRAHVITNGGKLMQELLAAAGLEHTVVQLESPGVMFRGRGTRGAGRKAIAFSRDWRVLRRIFKRLGPDVVHLNDLSPAGQIGLPPAVLAGIPSIVHVRTEVHPIRLLHRLVLAVGGANVTVSREVLARHLAVLNGTPLAGHIRARARALPNGVDLTSFLEPSTNQRDNARGQLGFTREEIVILGVGSLEPRKRQLHILRSVVPRVQSHLPSTRFVFAGGTKIDDAYAGECRAARERLQSPQRCLFLGYSPSVADLYAAADIVVLASTVEGLPRTLLEAMASARPVVATASPGARELLEGWNAGRLVDEEDDGTAFARSIVDIARLPQSTRWELGRNGRRRVEREFDIRAVAAAFEEICDEVTNGSP